VKLNCDLGEGFDHIDTAIMPLIDQASIACGAHAGNRETISHCVSLALQHQTEIGLHPSYPDRENFGRISLNLPAEELRNSLQNQISSALRICQSKGTLPSYIKPHGALYNDLSHTAWLVTLMLDVIAEFNRSVEKLTLALMLPASMNTPILLTGAKKQHIELIFEGFADRAYNDRAQLVARRHKHAVHHDLDKIIAQVEQFCRRGGVMSESGLWLPLEVQSLCIHGDNPVALSAVKEIKALGLSQ